MRILAIDLGGTTGWCMRYNDTSMDAGSWDLTPARIEGPGMRYIRFRALLKQMIAEGKPDLLAFEEVRRHNGTAAAQAYGGYRAVLLEECEAAKLQYTSVPVAAVKKLATGKGNAGKDQMVSAANAKWNTRCVDDNEADARWIAQVAAGKYA